MKRLLPDFEVDEIGVKVYCNLTSMLGSLPTSTVKLTDRTLTAVCLGCGHTQHTFQFEEDKVG
jgi:hypothetical protein